MKRKVIYFGLFLLLVNSNMLFSQDDYEIITYFKTSNGSLDTNINFEDVKFNFIRIVFPSFFDSKYSSKLYQLTRNLIYSTFSYGSFDNFDDYANELFRDYKKEQLQYKTPYWWHDIKIDVNVNTDKIASLSMNSYMYFGGAHGIGNLATLNYDKELNRIVHLDDIFVPNYESKLNKSLNNRMNQELRKQGEKEIKEEINFFNSSNYYYGNIHSRFLISQNSLLVLLDFYDDLNGTRVGMYVPKLEIPFTVLSDLMDSNYMFLLK